MTEEKAKNNTRTKKKLSRGQRTHVRRLKQEARKTSPIPK